MKIRIAAGVLGLRAMLLVPASSGYATLTPHQCDVLKGSIASLNTTIAGWSVWAPVSAKNTLIAKRDALQAKYNANCP